MNISNIPSSNPYDLPAKQQTDNLLTQAIKDYKDEYLTGLTDKEREEINKRIKEYLGSIPEGQKVSYEELRSLVASLLSKYGYKGDIDAMAKTLIGDVENELKQEAPTSSSAAIAYNKLSAATALKREETASSTPVSSETDSSSKDAAKGTLQVSSDDTPDKAKSEEDTISHTITNPDGSKSIVVIKNKVIMATYKLTEAGDILLERSSLNDVPQNVLTQDDTSSLSTH